MNKRIFIVLLFGLIVRLIFIFFYSNNNPTADAAAYHNYAVNIINYDLYSPSTQPLIDGESFFREPLNIYVLVASYKIAHLFNVDVNYIYNVEYHPELFFSRLFYALIVLLSIFYFYLTLLKVFPSKIKLVFYIMLATVSFYPLFSWEVTLLREPILFSILLILNYYLVSLFKNGSVYNSIAIGLLLGLAVLCMKAISIFGIFLFLFLCIMYWRKWVIIFKHISFMFLFTVLVISPRIYKMYSYFPDIKVVQSLGTSFTNKIMKCTSLYRDLEYYEIISDEEKKKELYSLWTMNSYDQFDISYNGKLQNRIDSLLQVLTYSPSYTYRNKIKRNSFIYIKALRKYLFPLHISFPTLKKYYYNSNYYAFIFNVFIIIVELLVSFFGIIGFFYYRKRYWYLMFVAISFLLLISLFPFYGNENRRLAILWYMYLPFSFLFINHLVLKSKIMLKK